MAKMVMCPRWARAVVYSFGLLLLLLSLSSCAGSSNYMKPSASQLVPTQDKALVRIMRPSGMGFAVNFNVLDGEKVIGNSVAKSQFDYLANPGRHLFISISENKVFLEADLAAGKLYYVITRIYPGFWRPRVAFEAVTRGSEYWDTVLQYEKELQRLEPDEASLRAWQDGHREEIQALNSSYEAEFKTKYNWPKLSPDDGR
jgi:hypothetical protein